MHRPIKTSKHQNKFSLSKNFHQTFFIYTHISEDVQLYPESPAKNRLKIFKIAVEYQRSPEIFKNHRRISTGHRRKKKGQPKNERISAIQNVALIFHRSGCKYFNVLSAPVSTNNSSVRVNFPLDDTSKKIRKPYTITKSRQNWTEYGPQKSQRDKQ
ncbi:hypothetical protein HanRHA438_Chr05g0226131 [Helianthus annuus]|nr:hypothetical protein HanRHA438_Chr05g0226131 [Helianthus annuus]